jgi:DNA sulfur modification protein DndE
MRLITSAETQIMLNDITKKLPFKSKAQLLRIALSKSLKSTTFRENSRTLKRDGFEINSDTLFGEKKELFLFIIGLKYRKKILSASHLNDLITYHLENGVKFIFDEFSYLKKDLDFLNFLQE